MADQKPVQSELDKKFQNVKDKVLKQVQGSLFGAKLVPLVVEIFGFMGEIVHKVNEIEKRLDQSKGQ